MINYPEKASLSTPAKRLVVLLHGVGSDGHDLISLVPILQPSMPDCHFISPHGVEAYDMAPFGYQWFSLSNRDPLLLRQLAANNAPKLMEIIRKKQEELHLGNKDTIIIGFSQGTMIGLYLTLLQEEPFKGIVGFSGVLVKPDNITNLKTPICLIHGEQDEVLPVENMHKTAVYLSRIGAHCITYAIPNLAHSIDGNGLDHAIKFINGL